MYVTHKWVPIMSKVSTNLVVPAGAQLDLYKTDELSGQPKVHHHIDDRACLSASGVCNTAPSTMNTRGMQRHVKQPR
eukprot:CAMPEP_0172913800 /NCGR_PEP_ID=MMETSP1075-20121228/191135_1 /TAXON_ID=2916 /ORGANISM="Ceratium fusus, Strain PA161109" /LENGTH=76 /DNA_ID=CAMNT_0013772597 /DNA_START=88 /DNA_END=318 /DNA_ORIENTATION=+